MLWIRTFDNHNHKKIFLSQNKDSLHSHAKWKSNTIVEFKMHKVNCSLLTLNLKPLFINKRKATFKGWIPDNK